VSTIQRATLFAFTYLALAMAPTIAVVVVNHFVDPHHVWLCMMPDFLFYGWNIGWAFLSLGFTNKFYTQQWIAGGAR
tara:strand:+ start:1308 stop:1538 length:231 start_codon:yes stop_codon:yes gene_type:complete